MVRYVAADPLAGPGRPGQRPRRPARPVGPGQPGVPGVQPRDPGECAAGAGPARALAAAHHIADLSPELADKQHVRRLLTQGEYDWLHVATHGGFIEEQTEARSGIRLEDGDLLRPEDLVGPAIKGHIGNARPGFFFNTCHGGRQGWALTRLGGWANRLIGAGAGLFIAPLWTVNGALAMKFADAFYGRIFEGQTIAAAGSRLGRPRIRLVIPLGWRIAFTRIRMLG